MRQQLYKHYNLATIWRTTYIMQVQWLEVTGFRKGLLFTYKKHIENYDPP